MVTYRGIEVNQEKVKSVLCMSSPRSVKEVQKLTRRIASLSRFISRSAHRSYPFFKVLRKAQQFGWDERCEQAFQDLKIHLGELPVLIKPEPREKLFVYLSTTEYAVSSLLIKEEGSDQWPVYYASHALRAPSSGIVSPLVRIMTHAEVSRRMIKWAVELGEYDTEYKPRVAIKAQALSDFLSEMVQPGEEEVTNNEAEYEAFLAGIRAAREVEASRIILYSDSQLITQQIKGVYEDKDDRMLKYLQLIKAKSEFFVDWNIEQILGKKMMKQML
ncbi:uncharacterized protein LOC142541869 [Primulina tabacum]|uniref:uncharacterized protein LOC142541869 n=1 Tax=Primulina tabacum TaxID=48773 RepID=UPI003F5A55B4